MITFTICLLLLIAGYFVYGRFIERIAAPDDRITPAVAKSDGVDFIVLPNWKIFMIQFLNISGTGPIFGAIMGAKFGPVAYLWIVFGCIFAGATHDYLSGMFSLRNGGASLPDLIGKYLGQAIKKLMLAFTVLLLVMVGAVFVYSPAEILHTFGGTQLMWVIIIFAYYFIATMLPVNKIIGKIYPVFAFSFVFMAVALMIMLFVKMPDIPELWDGIGNFAKSTDSTWTDEIFPCLFITIACGAISGFHATQSPLMARCIKSEKMARPIFYGSMITEGVVALIWATIASYFFYASPTAGYETIEGASGFTTSAPTVVNLICKDWLGVFGSVLAILGVVAAPITTGDTALRSARLIVADWLNVEQRSLSKRFLISIPLFAASILILLWQINNPNGFNVIWSYFGWSNQVLSVFTLWALTVYLVRERKTYWVMLIPALFMTTICTMFLFVKALDINNITGYALAITAFFVAVIWFVVWYRKNACQPNNTYNNPK